MILTARNWFTYALNGGVGLDGERIFILVLIFSMEATILLSIFKASSTFPRKEWVKVYYTWLRISE